MTTQYTPILQLALPVTGELNGTWGDVVNDNITSMVEEAIAGLATISTWTANSHTLTTANGTTDEARCAMLVAQDGAGGTALTGAGQIICPNRTKLFVLQNASSYAVTLKTAAGTGIAVASGDTAFLFCDSTNVNACVTQIINGHITGNLTVDGNATIKGNTSLGDATSDTITATARFASDVNPSADNTYDLGTSGNSWRNLYIDGTATIASLVATTADINGGTIDATSIGATTPSTGVFTQVDITAQGDLRLQDASGGQYVAMQAPATVPASYTLTWPDTDGDAGQALVTDGSGVLSWSTSASGDVYGPASATDNAVSRFDGTTGKLIQNSVVTIGDTGDVAGVGALSMSGAITLSGGTANGVLYLNGSKVVTSGSALTFDGSNFVVSSTLASETIASTGAYSYLAFTNSGGATKAGTIIVNSGGEFSNRSEFYTWKNYDASSEYMRLTSTGLGIGTSSPSELLTVAGQVASRQNTNASANIIVINSNTGSSANARFRLSSDVVIGNLQANSSTSTPQLALVCEGAYPLTFYTNNTERMRLDAAGNLGLGVTPSAWSGSGRVAMQIGGSTASYLVGSTILDVGVNAYYNGSVNKYIANGYATSYYQYNGQHVWRTATSGTAGADITFTQAMTLDASGRLLIGNTTNNAAFSGNLQVEGTSGAFASMVRYSTNAAGAPGFYLARSKGAAVGTNTIVASGDTLGNLIFAGADGTGYSNAAIIAAYVDGTPGASADMPGRLVFFTSADGSATPTERMRIDSAGNLGLGVTPNVWSIGKALEVGFSGNGIFGATASQLTITQNAYYNGAYYYGSTNAASSYRQNSGTHAWSIAPSGTVNTAITFTQAMTLDASGNLGIGTASPSAKLHVSEGAIRVGDASAGAGLGTYEFSYTGSASLASISAIRVTNNTTSNLLFSTAASGTLSEKMRLDSSGNLLIGTTSNSPSGKLNIAGNITPQTTNTYTLGTSSYVWSNVYATAFTEGAYPVVTQADIGTAPNEIPVNGMLGALAFQDVLDTVTNNPYYETSISDVQPSLLLDFANAKTLDPRITYTRASTATYYNGITTAVAEQNLFSYSQDFDNSYWTKGAVSITANSTTAPDGTTTADTLTGDGTATYHWVYASSITAVSTGQVYSVYAKAGTNNYIQILFGGDTSVYGNFDLTAGAGVIGTYGGTGTVTTITSVGNNWYRCTLYTPSANASQMYISLVSSASAARAQNNSLATTVYLWGAQMEYRSAVSSYTPTTSAAITNYIPAMQTAASGTPRFDFNPVTGESLGFLIEEQRNNGVTYSSDLSNAAWTKTGCSISADTVVAPDGTLTGDLVIANSGTQASRIERAIGTDTQPYAFSVYAKYAGAQYLILGFTNASGYNATFDILNGLITVQPTQSGYSAFIQYVGNGWYRCTWIKGTSSGGWAIYATLSSVSTSNTIGTTITGNGYIGAYIWGIQLEAGSFPTSYIPTVASTVTRAADAASMTGTNFSSWYNQAEGTLYGECLQPPLSSTTKDLMYINNAGVDTQFVYLRATNTSNVPLAGVVKDNTTQASFTFGSIPAGQTNKMAIAIAQNNFAGTSNSAVVQTDSSGNVPNGSTALYIGWYGSGGYLNSTIKKLAYYPKRLSDAEIQELTE